MVWKFILKPQLSSIECENSLEEDNYICNKN